MATNRHGQSSRRPAAAAGVPRSDTEPDEVIEDFRRGREIGKGSFATVYLAQHRKRKSYAAVKAVQQAKLSAKLKSNLEKEIDILKDLRHPHIVALFMVKESALWYYLVMEYCQLSDLSQFLKKRHNLATLPETRDIFRRYPNPEHGGFHEVLSRHFIKQIASALQYLRGHNLMHRDIKPQNMLLNPSPVEMSKWQPDDVPLAASEYSLVPAVGVRTLPMLKIADFGFARHLPSTSMAETLCGSPLYMAPEILRYERYESRADLWSTGGVLFEMVVGKPPFRAQNHVELLRKIEKANDVINFDNRNMTISRGMKDLIRKLLKKSSVARASWQEFFDDPVVTGDIPGLADDDLPYLVSKNMPVKEDTQLSRRMAKQAIDAPEQARPAAAESSSQPRRSQEDTAPRSSRQPSDDHESSQQPFDPGHRQSSAGLQTQSGSAPREIQRRSSQREQTKARRPSIVAHATAPARENLLNNQSTNTTTTAAPKMERRPSRISPLAGPPMVREPSDVDPGKLKDHRSERDAQERTAQDVAFEKEYVMIEKRAVEINAFADQLDNQNFHGRHSPQNQAAMVRRATTQGHPTAVTGAQPPSPSRAVQVVSGIPQSYHQRTGSLERRYGPSPQSAQNMLSKALTAANYRLFGALGTSPPFGKGPSPPAGYGAFPAYPIAPGTLLLGDGTDKTPLDEDTKIVRIMEEASHRSDVIFGFADVKYQQLVPATPSAQESPMIQQIGAVENQLSGEAADDEKDMTTVAIVGVAEEALVLYVKTLSILAKTIDLAGYWWSKQTRGEVVTSDPTSRPLSAGSSLSSEAGRRMNNVVQWARGRFNECLEKSEVTGRRLQAAQRDLPPEHPGHPNNRHQSASGATSNPGNATAAAAAAAVTASAEQIPITTGVTAEKLMFERAVEMSRSAALTELVGDALEDCEIGYITAILLLESVLEGDDEPLMRKPSSAKKDKAGDEVVSGLETEDRATVVKLIDSARSRLGALRKKMHAQAQQTQQTQQQQAQQPNTKRSSQNSITGVSLGAQRPASRPSPSASPVTGGTPPR